MSTITPDGSGKWSVMDDSQSVRIWLRLIWRGFMNDPYLGNFRSRPVAPSIIPCCLRVVCYDNADLGDKNDDCPRNAPRIS
jgi:hypothetical protein